MKFIRDFFGWQRNNYDKLGHFAQGFVPAILAREILLRHVVVNGRGWLNLLVISICLAFSALYELFEWGMAVATGDSANSFLGTQGYNEQRRYATARVAPFSTRAFRRG